MKCGYVLRRVCGALALTLLLALPVEARQDMSAGEVSKLLENPPAGLIVLDVRTPGEFKSGHIKGAVNMDALEADFLKKAAQLPSGVPLLIYCRSGNRSDFIIERMEQSGLKHEIYHLERGINDWKAAGLPLEQ